MSRKIKSLFIFLISTPSFKRLKSKKMKAALPYRLAPSLILNQKNKARIQNFLNILKIGIGIIFLFTFWNNNAYPKVEINILSCSIKGVDFGKIAADSLNSFTINSNNASNATFGQSGKILSIPSNGLITINSQTPNNKTGSLKLFIENPDFTLLSETNSMIAKVSFDPNDINATTLEINNIQSGTQSSQVKLYGFLTVGQSQFPSQYAGNFAITICECDTKKCPNKSNDKDCKRSDNINCVIQ